jgi:hypothetical protein
LLTYGVERFSGDHKVIPAAICGTIFAIASSKEQLLNELHAPVRQAAQTPMLPEALKSPGPKEI